MGLKQVSSYNMKNFNSRNESSFPFYSKERGETELSHHFQRENLAFGVGKSSKHRMDLTIIP